MTPAYTPDAAARHIIAYFVNRLGCRADETVPSQNAACMLYGTFTSLDFYYGIEQAENLGWIVIDLEQQFQLTAAGFDLTP